MTFSAQIATYCGITISLALLAHVCDSIPATPHRGYQTDRYGYGAAWPHSAACRHASGASVISL